MNYRNTQSALQNLHQIATAQGGYFTSKQAKEAGYTRQHINYHVRAGNFKRIERGLFRLPMIAFDENDEFIRLSLWSRDRQDIPQAVVSHESALALHNLSDMLPGKVHLTVPRKFRKKAPSNCQLHKGELMAKDISIRSGFKVTTPFCTLIDIATENSVPYEQLQLAVNEAMEEGMVTISQLKNTIVNKDISDRFQVAVKEVLQ